MKASDNKTGALKVAGLVLLYLASVSGVWFVGVSNARHKTEEMLNYACSDLPVTIEILYNGALSIEADCLMNALKSPEGHTVEEMRRLVDGCGLDELHLVGRDGKVFASSERSAIGFDIAANGETSALMALTNGTIADLRLPFMPTICGGGEQRLYSGFPFRDGTFAIGGYREDALERHFARHESEMMATWQFGESGCFVVADDRTGRIVFDVYGFGACGKTLKDIGAGNVASLPDDTEKTHLGMLFGERCHYRNFHYLGLRILAVVPHREYFDNVRSTTLVAAIVLLIVFAVFGFVFNRIAAANREIAKMRAAEDEKRLKDMAMATSIQKHSLPTIFPPFPEHADKFDVFASMDTAKEVGGDFYDFYFAGAGKLALVVADVSGKGVPAAMFMMRAKATLQGLLTSGVDLSTAVAATNDKLCEGNADGMFVTAWVGLYDIATGEIDFVNAGHNPPIVRTTAGGTDWIKARSGLPLATMEGVKYRTQSVKLNVGDLLLLYTDGVTEAQNDVRELYGEARLESCVNAFGREATSAECCRRLVTDINRFVAGAKQFDDITIMAFKVRRMQDRT